MMKSFHLPSLATAAFLLLFISTQAVSQSQQDYYYHHGEKVFVKDVSRSVDLNIKTAKQLSLLSKIMSHQNISVTEQKVVELAEDSIAVLTKDIIVKAKAGEFSVADLRSLKDFVSYETIKGLDQVYRVTFNSESSALSASKILFEANKAQYAHPDFILPIEARNIDPWQDVYFPSQWHLSNTGQSGGLQGLDINVLPAWQTTYGQNNQPVVAVIDFGFESNHPDLRNIWHINPNEIPGNNIDDDNNGKVDDVKGWNFQSNSANLLQAVDPNHGTSVAGLVAARANGIGVVGSCPMCRVLPITISGIPSQDARAFLYAMERGADIITNSWGYNIGTSTTEVVEEAIRTVATQGRSGKGTSIFFAMNNLHVDDCSGSRPDISSHKNVVAVSSIDNIGQRVFDSGYGKCMQFLSTSYYPGVRDGGLVSTDRVGSFGYNRTTANNLTDLDYTSNFGGTSGATPIAAGAFALLYDLNPNLTHDEAIKILRQTARKVNPNEAGYNPQTGHSSTYGYGLINISEAIKAVQSTL